MRVCVCVNKACGKCEWQKRGEMCYAARRERCMYVM